MTTASASGAPRITGTGSPRSEPRSEVLEIPRTKRRRPTLNAFSAIEVLVPYRPFFGSIRASAGHVHPHRSRDDEAWTSREPRSVGSAHG